MKTKLATLLLPMLLLVGGAVPPLVAYAQCGPGSIGGFGGPTHIVIDGSGVYYGGFSGGRGSEWSQFIEDMRNQVDYEYHGSTFSLLDFLLIPVAQAQCGGNHQPPTGPVAVLTATPGSVLLGNSSVLTWGSQNAAACYSPDFATGGATSGSTTVAPSETTTYNLTCSTVTAGSEGCMMTGSFTYGGPAQAQEQCAASGCCSGMAICGGNTGQCIPPEGGVTQGSWQNAGVEIVNYSCSSINSGDAMGMDFCPNNQAPQGSCTVGDTCKTSTNGMYPAPSQCVQYQQYDEMNIYECQGPVSGQTASDTATVAVQPSSLVASCSVAPTTAAIGQNVTWTASATGGSGTYTYAWSGTGGLAGTGASVQKSYTSGGTKTGSVTVTSGSQVSTMACTNSVTVGTTQCSDGLNNDNEGGTDWPDDTDCRDSSDDSEGPSGPTATLTGNPTTVVSGGTSMLTWSSSPDVTSCVNAAGEGNGGFATGGRPNGSDPVGPLTANANYQVRCTSPGGTVTDSELITVNTPVAHISASPDRVESGTATTLSFSASGVTGSCSVSRVGGATIWGPTVGPTIATTTASTGKITNQSTFEISCDSGAAKDSVLVNIIPQFDEF